MPQGDGKLTKEDRIKITEWINDKSKSGTNLNCPVCTENNWAIGDHILYSSIYTPNNIIIGGAYYPLVFIVCNN